MSNVSPACKSFVFALVVLSTAVFVAGIPMKKEQKDEGMLLFGKALFGKDFNTDKLEEYKDALADVYTNMEIHALANHSSLLQNSKIVMSQLGDTSVWKMIFPSVTHADHTAANIMSKLLSSVGDIQKTLEHNKVNPFDVVGFNMEWIGVADTKTNEKKTQPSKGLLQTAVMGGLGVLESLRVSTAPVTYHLVATITTRRSKLEGIFIAHSLRKNFKESRAERVMDIYATRWANKNSLGIDSAQYPLADSKEFLSRISKTEIEPLLKKMKAAAKQLDVEAEPNSKVRIGLANILDTNVGDQPQPTDNYFVYLVCQGLMVEIKHKLLKALFGENFMDHQFEETQVTDTNCHLCHHPLSVSTSANHCKDCNMFVHKLCPAVNPVVKRDVFFALQTCFHFIEENLEDPEDAKGIYRVGGSITDIENLQAVLDEGMCMSNAKLWIHAKENLHNISGVVKKYLREMPKLIPSIENIQKNWKHSGDEIATLAENEKKLKIEQNNKNNVMLMNSIINSLPPGNKMLLKLVLKHLNGLLSFAKVTKMDAYNLSVVIGPNIFDDIFGNSVCEVMITHFKDLDIAGKEAI